MSESRELNMYLDPTTHDLQLDATGNIQVTADTEELLSVRIKTRFSTFRGEWFLDRNLGVPYFEEVMVKNPDVNAVRNLLLAQLVDIPGVDEVLSFDVNFNTASRLFQVNFKVRATDGTIVEGEI